MKDEEDDLLRRLLDGCETAFEDFYNQMAPRWVSFLTSERRPYQLSLEEAQDVVQQAMLVILSKMSQFDPKGSATFSSWCYGIVINIAAWRRREKFRLIYFSEVEEEVSLSTELLHFEPDEEPKVTFSEDELESWLQGDGEVRNALRSLRELERVVVVLKALCGLTHKEIANRLGKSEAAVRVQYHRAVSKLKLIL